MSFAIFSTAGFSYTSDLAKWCRGFQNMIYRTSNFIYFINMVFLVLGKNALRPPVVLSMFYDFPLNSIRFIILTNVKFQ